MITALSGNDVVLGIFEYRLLALAGLGLIVWALPKLARRCGLDTGLAMWLGAANPLVLFHLVSGMHNEALMVGLMLAGFEIGLRSGERLLDRQLLAGALLIVAASAIKLPAHPRAGLPRHGVGPPPRRAHRERRPGGRPVRPARGGLLPSRCR